MPSRTFRSARQHLMRTNSQVLQAVRQELFFTGEDLMNMARDATSDWKHKPRWRKQMDVSPSRISVTIEPTGDNAQIFNWVDQGTEGPYRIPKFIRPITQSQGKQLLKFRTGYSARTAAVAKHHQGSGRATGAWATAEQVTHPGIEAREFIKTFNEDLKPTLNRRVDNAIRRATR